MYYLLNPDLIMRIEKNGSFVLTINSEFSIEANIDVVNILKWFCVKRTKNQVFSLLINENNYDILKRDFEKILLPLVKNKIITKQSSKSRVDQITRNNSNIIEFSSVFMHHFMLIDTIRVSAYKRAISKVVNGRNVLDLGSGTGILSFFSAKYGAKKVVAVERTSIFQLARKIISDNKMEKQVEILNISSKKLSLNYKFDIVIHEIFGTDPFEENVLEFISDAKKRLLKKGGIIIPYKFDVCCFLFEEDKLGHIINEALILNELYDINLTSYIDTLKKEKQLPSINLTSSENICKGKQIVSEEILMFSINFYKDFDKIVNKTNKHKVKLRHCNRKISGAIVFFKIYLDDDETLTTSPFSSSTHWKQKVLYFPNSKWCNDLGEFEFSSKVASFNGSNSLIIE